MFFYLFIYLGIYLVGPNQRTTRGDRPIHLAARSSSFQVLDFFKTLPEYAQMKESRNVEGHRPVDIVNEKEDTEVKSKLLGMSSYFNAENFVVRITGIGGTTIVYHSVLK